MYPSKILLFGEYTILLSSYALAIPFHRYSGDWAFKNSETGSNSGEQDRSNERLKGLLVHLRKSVISTNLICSIDIDAFEEDIEKGLFFKSDIPEESGLGSSGALTAAIFNRYSDITNSETNTLKIRRCLSFLESFYHGQSSGIDPLVSYFNSPLLIKDEELNSTFNQPVEKLVKKYGMFLIQCSKYSRTGDLVYSFKSRIKTDPAYSNKITYQYIPVNNKCITALINTDDTESFFSSLKELTGYQAELFSKMIPEEIIPVMNYGLENDLFYMKLCGSGGGGYFLGFTKNLAETIQYFKLTGHHILVY